MSARLGRLTRTPDHPQQEGPGSGPRVQARDGRDRQVPAATAAAGTPSVPSTRRGRSSSATSGRPRPASSLAPCPSCPARRGATSDVWSGTEPAWGEPGVAPHWLSAASKARRPQPSPRASGLPALHCDPLHSDPSCGRRTGSATAARFIAGRRMSRRRLHGRRRCGGGLGLHRAARACLQLREFLTRVTWHRSTRARSSSRPTAQFRIFTVVC